MAEKKGPADLTIREVETRLRSLSSYYQGHAIATPKAPNETDDDHDLRCWKERCNALPDGHLFIPPEAFKLSVVSAARLLNEKISGKGNQTWAKQFQCGLLIPEGIVLPETLDTVFAERKYVQARGQSGGTGPHVWRTFPRVDKWEGVLTWYIASPHITEEALYRVLKAAGMMIGVGSFRAEKGPHNGRFEILSLKW